MKRVLFFVAVLATFAAMAAPAMAQQSFVRFQPDVQRPVETKEQIMSRERDEFAETKAVSAGVVPQVMTPAMALHWLQTSVSGSAATYNLYGAIADVSLKSTDFEEALFNGTKQGVVAEANLARAYGAAVFASQARYGGNFKISQATFDMVAGERVSTLAQLEAVLRKSTIGVLLNPFDDLAAQRFAQAMYYYRLRAGLE